jgi:hypothetical protein
MTKPAVFRRLAAAAIVAAMAGGAIYVGTSQAGTTTSSIPGAKAGNAPGTSNKTIKFAVFINEKTCGDEAATAATVDGTYERFNTLVKWFNQHISFPGGRKLAVEYINDGGADPTCADVATAAINQAVTQDHVFAILDDEINPGIGVPAIVSKDHTVFIGNAFETFADLKSGYPYVWSTYEPAQLSFEELSWFIGKRFKTNPYVADSGAKSTRVWGELFTDNLLGHALARDMQGYMTKAGIANVTPYFISPVASTAAQQASGLALQMQQAGVNSLIYSPDALVSDIGFNTAAANAGYHPDFFISAYGSLPELAVFVPFFGANFSKRLYGTGPPIIWGERIETDSAGDVTPTACPSCFGQDNGIANADVKAYQQAGGAAGDHPGIASWGYGTFIWPDLATLVIGAANAGPVLNANTFAYGLEHGANTTCMTQQFFGKQPYAQGALYTFNNPARNYLQSGFTTLYFDPTMKNTYGTTGLFQSYDDYKMFTSANSLPATPSYDTGVNSGYKLIKQTGKYNVDTHCQ